MNENNRAHVTITLSNVTCHPVFINNRPIDQEESASSSKEEASSP